MMFDNLHESYLKIMSFRAQSDVFQTPSDMTKIFPRPIRELLDYVSCSNFEILVDVLDTPMHDVVLYCNTAFMQKCIALPIRKDVVIVFFMDEQSVTLFNIKFSNLKMHYIDVFNRKS